MLLVEDPLHLLEALERMPRKRVEPVISGTFETEGANTTQEEVVVKVYFHLVLVLPMVLDGISRFRVVFEAQYHKLFGEW